MLIGVNAFPACGDCLDDSGNGQFWVPPHVTFSDIPSLFINFYSTPDCSGSATGPTQEAVFPVLMRLSGIYYLFAFIVGTTLIFYATSTSIFGPFNNILSCNPDYVTFSDPAIMCFNNGSPRDYNVIGEGGTATVIV